MGTFAVLMLATPVFGFSLSLDPGLQPASVAQTVQVHAALQEPLALATEEIVKKPLTAAELIQKRERLGKIHKYLGIATWGAMTVTLVTGYIQYHNKYGFFAGQGDNPCVKGKAIFGQKQCRGQPVFHLTTSALTGALYFSTFALSFTMPDPLKVSEGNSRLAKRLRLHKTLRWVHFAGMLAQIGLGAITANSERFGLDRANDYKALRALSTVHLATGILTYGALTWSGALMTF